MEGYGASGTWRGPTFFFDPYLIKDNGAFSRRSPKELKRREIPLRGVMRSRRRKHHYSHRVEEEGAVDEDEDEDFAELTKLCSRRSSRIA